MRLSYCCNFPKEKYMSEMKHELAGRVPVKDPERELEQTLAVLSLFS